MSEPICPHCPPDTRRSGCAAASSTKNVPSPQPRSTSTGASGASGKSSALMRVAIEVSRSESFKGRVGLHSLPQACAFYRNVCKMSDLGADADYHGLVYFEMTEDQAKSFCEP